MGRLATGYKKDWAQLQVNSGLATEAKKKIGPSCKLRMALQLGLEKRVTQRTVLPLMENKRKIKRGVIRRGVEH